VAAVAQEPGDFVWDAELTVDDANGRSIFSRIQSRARTSSAKNIPAAVARDPARLYFFDILAAEGQDLRRLPLSERKVRLRESFNNTSHLIYASGIEIAGEWVFDQAKALGLEGMVAKRLDSSYHRGYSQDWLKIKDPNYSRDALKRS
jgi:bifunctional non-homologous end joining protein LigD